MPFGARQLPRVGGAPSLHRVDHAAARYNTKD